MTRKDAGFTLIEAMIAMLIVSILVCIVHPLYLGAVFATRIGDARAQLYDTLMVSMRHAMVTSTSVVLCPSKDLNSCSGDADWSAGWLAFSDLDRNRIRGPGEPILRRQPALPAGIQLLGSSGRTRLVFRANGGNPGSNATFTFCDRRGRARAVSVMLANSGRLRQAEASAAAADACRTGA